jgi:rhamnose utilization protein RhaD (predicted bifunctional aldolase and dehydrogenase)/NAD(P)-dependent dehydrogenase (short-subunit alcohol dehydrogenase family)
MQNRWNEDGAVGIAVRIVGPAAPDLTQRIYTAHLLGEESELVLHGGGNVSVKATAPNIFGDDAPVTFVKASGRDMRVIDESGFVALDQDYLAALRKIDTLTDGEMKTELSLHLARPSDSSPSIEALMHVFLPPKYIDHTHPASILALTNRTDGDRVVREVLGEQVTVIPYVKPGFQLAKVVAQAYDDEPETEGMVLLQHGLVTWGATAREAYDKTVELVTRAEEHLERSRKKKPRASLPEAVRGAEERYRTVAPVLRGLAAPERSILKPWISEEILSLLEMEKGEELASTPPLTPDHVIRTGLRPLWIGQPAFDDSDKLRKQITEAIEGFSKQYADYLRRNSTSADSTASCHPRTILFPGMGAVCVGRDAREAIVARDITRQTLSVKLAIAESDGTYQGLSEDRLYAMEFDEFQQAKLERETRRLPSGTVALVTGAAGAIGSGICQRLLQEGCHVAVTDLAGANLDSLWEEFRGEHGGRVLRVPLDVTQEESVTEGFQRVIDEWGGMDLLVVNAGLALVSSLGDMELEDFQRLERVNVEGTLLGLREAARLFGRQATGGDVVVVSTKNVFAPGAGFGAYSATKAASHQLARIASQEFAEIGVRVNMVAPDAVFGHGERKSGLWAEVGPDRMRARGLDEEGLEEYYRNRNLLKAKVTAEHVANAVMFFATRQTPTTGATIPVDGGLPDATPR